MDNATAARPAVLSNEQLSRYERDGYLAPVPALTAGEASGYLRKIEAFEAQHGVDKVAT